MSDTFQRLAADGDASHSPLHTVLWQPEMAPPNEWLHPAILFHDRISTIVPDNDVPAERIPPELCASLARSRHLADVLEGLYVPTRLSHSRMRLAENWVPRMVNAVATEIAALGARATDAERQWLDFVAQWDALGRRQQDTDRELHACQRLEREARAALADATNAAELAAGEAFAETKKEFDRLRRDWLAADARGETARASSLRRAVDDARATHERERRATHERPPFDTLIPPFRARADEAARAVGNLEAQQREIERGRVELMSEATEFAQRIHERAMQGQLTSGWTSALASKMTSSFHGELRQGPGFLFPTSEVFYAPVRLMCRLFADLSLNFCDVNGWSAMSSLRTEPLQPHLEDTATDNPAAAIDNAFTALCFEFIAPTFDPSTPLDEVLEFRREHSESLAAMQSAIRLLVESSISTTEDLTDLRSAVEAAVSAPLNEVDRALQLRGRRISTKAAVVVRNPLAGIPIAGSLAQRGGESVINGLANSAPIAAALHGAVSPAAFITGAAVLGARATWIGARALQSNRRAQRGPLAYLYEVRRTFD